MTTTFAFLQDATSASYSTKAFEYVSPLVTDISTFASIIGISAGAIAGAMLEEANDYYPLQWRDDPLDKYALSGLNAAASADSLLQAVARGEIGVAN